MRRRAADEAADLQRLAAPVRVGLMNADAAVNLVMDAYFLIQARIRCR